MKILLSRLATAVLLLPLLSLALWSCGTTETAAQKEDREHTELYKTIDDTIIQGYLKRHHIGSAQYTRTSSGLYLINIADGQGPFITTGKIFSVRYIGRLLGYANSGTVFENTYENRTTCQCNSFAAGQNIAGWNEAVQLMQAGSKKTLLIPSYLAYGRYGSGSIPGDQPLLFDMEIVSVAQ